MLITIDNRYMSISGCNLSLVREFDRRTAPFLEGHQYNVAYQNKWWDGREHLVKKVRKAGWKAPSGLYEELRNLCDEKGIIVTADDRRKKDYAAVAVNWDSAVILRPYQIEAVEAAICERGLGTGKGLLRLATRSGKTVIAAGIISKLKLKTLFIVQSEMLLSQTVALFKRVLCVEIGQIGGGLWQTSGITVASVQTLVKHSDDEATKALLAESGVVFFDECHHISGEKWRAILTACDSLYKFGLSATIPDIGIGDTTQKGAIWLKASCGPILYDLPVSSLINQGWLIRPTIRLHVVTGNIAVTDYGTAYRLGITDNAKRNMIIAVEAAAYVKQGLSVLVVTNRIEHVEILEKVLLDAGLRIGVVTGTVRPQKRRQLVAQYVNHELDVLLGTVFGEGVDIPSINVVINAEGGKDEKQTMQRFRNLTPADGKTKAVFVDFMDNQHPYLAGHSLERLKTYRENEAFNFEVVR